LLLRICGRGSKQRREISLPKADGFDIVAVSCPHGCRLQLRTSVHDKTKVEVHIRCENESTEPIKLSFGSLKTRNPNCPKCAKHMAITLVEDNPYHSKQEKTEKTHAFMACLWAPEDNVLATGREKVQRYITDALVLGFSLSQSCPAHPRVLLCSSEVGRFIEIELLRLYWEVKFVKHLEVHPTRVNAKHMEARFSKVFTKLRCWEQIEYSKICILDLDIIVTKSIHDIFDNQAPAAVFRGNVSSPPGIRRDSATIYSKRTGQQQGGINAGVMVIEPSIDEFRNMHGILKSPGKSTTAPEQDFLSTMFPDMWSKLDVKYNWQPHQFRHVAERDLSNTERQLADDIRVYHFSGALSPRDFLFKASLRETKETAKYIDFEEFAMSLANSWGCSKLSEIDSEKIRVAINAWKWSFVGMWSQLVATTAGNFSRCPACEDMEGSIEHAFLSCAAVQEYRNTWKKDPRYALGGQSELEAIRFNYDLFPASLYFVACVFQRRHPKGTELLRTPEPVTESHFGRFASRAKVVQKIGPARKEDDAGPARKRKIVPNMLSSRRMKPRQGSMDVRVPSQNNIIYVPMMPMVLKAKEGLTRFGEASGMNPTRVLPASAYKLQPMPQPSESRGTGNVRRDERDICWNFRDGFCRVGDRCRYRHAS